MSYDIVRIFEDGFQKYGDKKIALYGTNSDAGLILSGCARRYRITGVMDGFRQRGIFQGHRIITLEEALAHGVDIIAIVARPSSQKIVFNRIKDFCAEHGILICDVFGSSLFDYYKRTPARNEESAAVRSCFEMGRRMIAPLAAALVFWLAGVLENRGYRYILFIARDGWLIEKMYGAVRSQKPQCLPEGVYFLASRTVCAAAVCDNPDYIEYFADFASAYSPEQLLRKRFSLNEEEIKPFDEWRYANAKDYVLSHSQLIMDKARKLKRQYFEYCRGTIPALLRETEKIAIFDLVSTGTCQMCLQEIFGWKLDGYYLAHVAENYEKKQKLSIASMLDDSQNSLLDNYIFLEPFLKSPDPSLLRFSDSGEPVFHDDPKNDEFAADVRDIQAGILSYFDECLERPDFWESDDCRPRIMSAAVLLSDDCVVNFEHETLKRANILDVFSGRIIEMKDWFGGRIGES